MRNFPVRSRLWLWMAAGFAVLAAPVAALAGDAFIYAGTLDGKVGANGVELDRLPGNFDGDRGRNLDHAWVVTVDGDDRFALRRDGRVMKNGEDFTSYPRKRQSGEFWISADAHFGSIYALSQDGMVAKNRRVIYELPTDRFVFTKVRVIFGTVYALRSDGALFVQNEEEPSYRFVGGPGVFGQGDGLAADTTWVSLDFYDFAAVLWAIRADGTVWEAEIIDGAPEGEFFGNLPFPTEAPLAGSDFYVDIAVTDGDWKALRANGEIYEADDLGREIIDLPGEATTSRDSFTDLAALGSDLLALRADGVVFRSTSEEPLITFSGTRFESLDISDEGPNTGLPIPRRPDAITFKTKTVIGTPFFLPVIINDEDTPAGEHEINVLEFPEGSGFDPDQLLFAWSNPDRKGNFKFRFEIDDGSSRPRRITYTLSIRKPDEKENRNKKPLLPKILNAEPIAGQLFSIPLILDDPDGDFLFVRVDTSAYPFTAGAVFDPSARIFSWTPGPDDEGRVSVEFFIDDGSGRISTLTVRLNVIIPEGLAPIDL